MSANPQDHIREMATRIQTGKVTPGIEHLDIPRPPAPPVRRQPVAPTPEPTPPPAPAALEPPAEEARPPSAKQAAPKADGGGAGEPKGRQTGVVIPADIVLALRRKAADARIDGHRYTIEEAVNAALDQLPDDPTDVLTLLEQHRAAINFELRPGDPGYLATTRLLVRLTPTNRTKIERLIAELTLTRGRQVRRQDLWAAALISVR